MTGADALPAASNLGPWVPPPQVKPLQADT